MKVMNHRFGNVDKTAFRNGMSRLGSAVSVVTTIYEGKRYGFLQLQQSVALATHQQHFSSASEGYAGFKGKIDQEIAETFDEAGFYGIKCSPHIGMGTVMIVKVGGAAVTPDLIQADLPQRAKKRFQEILDRAGEKPQ